MLDICFVLHRFLNAKSTSFFLQYHPLEIARQLTLLEFEYYRAVDSSELVDQAWMSKDKVQRCPNLLRVSAHSNNVSGVPKKN